MRLLPASWIVDLAISVPLGMGRRPKHVGTLTLGSTDRGHPALSLGPNVTACNRHRARIGLLFHYVASLYGEPPLVPGFAHSARPSASLAVGYGWPKKPCSGGFHVALFATVSLYDLLLSVPCRRSFNAEQRRARAHQ